MAHPAPRRRELVPLLVLALALCAVFWRLCLLRGLLVTDDLFTSDLMNEGFPYRFALGAALGRGEAPLWLPTIYGGFPLLARAEAGIAYPLNLLAFGLLPPHAALNLVVVATVVLAGVGAYLYARELQVEPAAAAFAGLAFGLSGFMVSHLKHLSNVNAACWIPWGLWALERGIAKDRPRALVGLGLVFGLQVLSGHAQIAYYSALLYGAYALVRLWMTAPGGKPLAILRDRRAWWALAAMATAALLGGIQLLPTYELVGLTQRAAGVSLDYATQYPFDPISLAKFVWPAAFGEVADMTYQGKGVYWEEYGYVGILTLAAAGYAAVAGRRRWEVKFFGAAAIVGLLLALGASTPLYGVAHTAVPFLKFFRFPARFLVIVDLSLAVLGGIGLGLLGARLAKAKAGLLWAAFALSFADLAYHQSRQNAVGEMAAWKAEPATVAALRPLLAGDRIFSLAAQPAHLAAFEEAQGWLGSLGPFLAQRDLLQPSSNVLYGIPTPDGYAQLCPKYVVDVWGDQNRKGAIRHLWKKTDDAVEVRPPFKRLLSMHAVAYVLSPAPIVGEDFEPVQRIGVAHVYRNPDRLPRAFVVGRAVHVAEPDVLPTLLSERFDPRLEALVERPIDLPAAGSFAGEARVVASEANEVAVRTSANARGLLVLSDMHYPGWEATVDGAPAEIHRANGTMRAVLVEAGEHEVRFAYRPRSVRWGGLLSAIGALLLGVGLVASRRSGPGAS